MKGWYVFFYLLDGKIERRVGFLLLNSVWNIFVKYWNIVCAMVILNVGFEKR